MVIQYPHTATFQSQSENATQVDGIWVKGTSSQDIVQACRYEPTTLNRELFTVDGVDVKLKGILYSPLNTPEIKVGLSIVSIVNQINEIIAEKQKVLFFDRGEIGCRIFV